MIRLVRSIAGALIGSAAIGGTLVCIVFIGMFSAMANAVSFFIEVGENLMDTKD